MHFSLPLGGRRPFSNGGFSVTERSLRYPSFLTSKEATSVGISYAWPERHASCLARPRTGSSLSFRHRDTLQMKTAAPFVRVIPTFFFYPGGSGDKRASSLLSSQRVSNPSGRSPAAPSSSEGSLSYQARQYGQWAALGQLSWLFPALRTAASVSIAAPVATYIFISTSSRSCAARRQ